MMEAKEILKLWDDYQPVPSASVGGIGPGYEQACQVAMIACLRQLVEEEYPFLSAPKLEHFNPVWASLDRLGLSGNQCGVAVRLAWKVFQQGMDSVREALPVERHILVNRDFPGAVDEVPAEQEQWQELRRKLHRYELAHQAYGELLDRMQGFCSQHRIGRYGESIIEILFEYAEAGARAAKGSCIEPPEADAAAGGKQASSGAKEKEVCGGEA